jgi:N-glycosylase/DNA lyase
MDKLYNKLKKYTLEDAIKIEEQDRQFLALKNLYKNKKINNFNYLFLIIANALICYQLS